TRAAATKTVKFFVNHVVKGVLTYTNAPASSGNAVFIGRSRFGIQYVNGLLDEVALYNAALSPAQIANHYALQTSTSTGAGKATTADASGHELTGAINGGVTPNQPGPLADGNPAMRFDGATGYVLVPNAAALQLTGDLTIELWVNTSVASRQTLISKDYLHEFELTLETTGALDLYHGNGVVVEN